MGEGEHMKKKDFERLINYKREKSVKKRTESNLVNACLKYLKVLENQGNILWAMRLNSGAIFTGKRMIKLSPPGTPDIVFFNTTHLVWIECKSPTGKLSERQLRFSDISTKAGHKYVVIREIGELQKLWLSLKT